MNKYNFGERSLEQLATLHPDLQLIMLESLKNTDVDFSLVEGHRTVERQNKLYKKGLSKIDGIKTIGKHNVYPSEAVDIVIYTSNRDMRKRIAYDFIHLAYVGGVITSTAKQLFVQGKISHLIRWGLNWDRDGILKFDQTFIDAPHFEIFKP